MRKILVFVALVGLAMVGGPVTPAGAAFADVPDSTGDGPTHGDATALQITHGTTSLSLSLSVAQAEDPATATNWTDAASETHVEWDIDTNGTGLDEFYVLYGSDGEGGILADVFDSADDAAPICSADPSFSSGAYRVVVARSCIGNPPNVRVSGTMTYDPTPGGASDTNDDKVPNSGFSDSVAAAPAAADRAVRAGVVGLSDNQLWSGHGFGGVYDSLGGQLIAAPAIARVAQSDPSAEATAVYIGTGTDHALWVRRATDNWRPLSTAHTYCVDNPAAVVYGTGGGNQEITVACRGSDNALWASSAAISPSSVPTMNSWRRIGGVLTAGPAVSISQSDSKTVAYLVVGTGGKVYESLGTGFAPTPWTCKNHVAFGALNDVSWFGCRGTDDGLWIAKNTASGWTAAMPLGGTLTEGPGVAVTNATTVFFVQGTDNGVWQRVVNNSDNAPLSSFTSNGGKVKFGVGAASL